MPDGVMTRREFAGWLLASVAAIVAGSQVWRLFRRLAEQSEARAYSGQFSVGESHQWAIIRNDQLVTNAVWTITAVDTRRKSFTMVWSGQPAMLWDDDYVVFANA